jgi:hypothetical protein
MVNPTEVQAKKGERVPKKVTAIADGPSSPASEKSRAFHEESARKNQYQHATHHRKARHARGE